MTHRHRDINTLQFFSFKIDSKELKCALYPCTISQARISQCVKIEVQKTVEAGKYKKETKIYTVSQKMELNSVIDIGKKLANLAFVGPASQGFVGEDLGSELLKTIKLNSVESTRKLLEKGADPNTKDRFGESALYLAITCRDDYNMVDLLLDYGADPNLYGNQTTPLMSALFRKRRETAKLLLEAGADPNKSINNHNAYLTHLNYAADKFPAAVLNLCKYGADPNIKSKEGLFPLHYAVSNDETVTDIAIRSLILVGADYNAKSETNGETPLYTATNNRNFDNVQQLLEAGADPNIANIHKNTPLNVAMQRDELDIFKLLLDFGADAEIGSIPGDEKNPFYAIVVEHLGREQQKMAMRESQRTMKRPRDEVLTAVDKEKRAMMFKERACNADEELVTAPTKNALASLENNENCEATGLDRFCCKKECLVCGDALEGKGVELNPCKHTTCKDCWEAWKTSLSSENKELTCPFCRAVQNPPTLYEVYQMGVKNEIDNLRKVERKYPGIVNRDGMDQGGIGLTALHGASRMGHLEAVKLLVEDLSADINKTDYEGTTPLHFAARAAKLDVVRFLVEKGADLYIEDFFGDSALDKAVNKKNHDVMEYLTERLNVGLFHKHNI